MKLHEAIQEVLYKSEIPLTAKEIAGRINTLNLYSRNDLRVITRSQVNSRIKKYPNLFYSINGYYLNISNRKWQELLSNYWNLVYSTQEIFEKEDHEYLILYLLFYKRIIDLNNQGRLSSVDPNLPSDWLHLSDFYCDSVENLRELQIIDLQLNFDVLIFEGLSQLLDKYSGNHRSSLSNILFEFFKGVDTNEFTNEEFGIAYEYLIGLNSDKLFVRTPGQVIELMYSILDPKSGSFYDPVCGTGGFLTYAFRKDPHLFVIGSEIIQKVSHVAFMNQFMNGDFNPNIFNESCFRQLESNKKFDYLIGDLPLSGLSNQYAQQLSYKWGLNFSSKSRSFGPFLLFGLDMLSEKGKAVFTISDSFLLKKTGIEPKVRKVLLEEDIIEAIISLPDGILKPYTPGKVSLIVLNKSKAKYFNNKIKFINPENIQSLDNLSLDRILDSYFEVMGESEMLQIVSKEEIQEVDSFNPKYFTQAFTEIREMISSGQATYLSSVVNLASGKNLKDRSIINVKEGIPFVRIENLNRNVLDNHVDFNQVNSFIAKVDIGDRSFRSEFRIISKPSILIARIGDHLKPTIFTPDDEVEVIILHQNVIAITPKTLDLVFLEYLYYQLYSDFILTQIDAGSGRSVMPFRTHAQLKEVIIQIPPVSAQNEFISNQKANSIAAERARLEARSKELGFKEEAEERELNIVRTITHQFRHRLSSLEIRIKKIQDIVNKNDLNDFRFYEENDPILRPEEGLIAPENYSIESVLRELKKESSHLGKLIKEIEKAINLELSFESIKLKTFFLNLKDQYKDECFKFEVSGDESKVDLSKIHFKELVDNLLKNALQHGFNSSTKNPMVRFKIKIDRSRQLATIEYTNNGSALKISQKEYESVLAKSKASNGSGVGGFYISKIIEGHNGIMEIDESYTKGFKMTIEFPIKQKNYE